MNEISGKKPRRIGYEDGVKVLSILSTNQMPEP